MKRYAWMIAIALVAAACGGDDSKGGGKGGGGGDGGAGGGGGGGGGPAGPLTVTNGLERTYFGGGLEIVADVPGKNQTVFVRATMVAKEDRDGDGVAEADGAAYELDITFPGSDLAKGDVWVGAFFAEPPELLGRGMVSLEVANGSDHVFASVADKVLIKLEGGKMTGTVESAKQEIAAAFAGEFTLRCRVREASEWVDDTDFVSEECQKFAHLLGE